MHSHGPEGEHSHPTMVARTWLDPAIAKKQATYIANELSKVYPDQSDKFESNLKSLSDELDLLLNQISAFNKDDAHAVITATPKQKFFTRSAGVGDQHLTWFETPSIDQARLDLEKVLESEGPKPTIILFDDKLPSDELTAILKENGLTPMALNLIDRKPDSGDYLSQLRANIEALAVAVDQ